MDIKPDTSPELAIKIAYDFAKTLRSKGATDRQIADQLDIWVEKPFRTSVQLIYARAGFTAGYHWEMLPWRREIEASERRTGTEKDAEVG